jgi:hypothetical protein
MAAPVCLVRSAYLKSFTSLFRSRKGCRSASKRRVRVFDHARGECRHILPGLFPWELQLPWAPIRLKYDPGAGPERVDHDSGLACAKGVIVNTCRGVGTSATVTPRSVSGKSVVGRRRGARPSTARMPRPGHATPRRRRSAVNELRPHPRPLRMRILRLRVVTRQVQQKNFSPPLCNRPGCHEAPVTSPRNPARYCCPACRQAVRNVLDRERKWLARGRRWLQEAGHRVPGRAPPALAAMQRR